MAENNSPPPLMTDKELLMETGAFNEIMNAAFEYADAYCASGDEPRRYSAAIDHLRKTVRAEITKFSRANYKTNAATEFDAQAVAAQAPSLRGSLMMPAEPTPTPSTALASLRHLYQQLISGTVKDASDAKRIATGLLGPAIEKLEAGPAAPAAVADDAPLAVRTAPKKIWLDLGDDEAGDCDFSDLEEVTWSSNNASGCGIEYVRAALAATPALPATEDSSAGDLAGWAIDVSAGREILVYKNCSVIEAEQAHLVLSLIRQAEVQAEPVAPGTRLGRAEVRAGKVGYFAFEQTDLDDGDYFLYTAPQAQPADALDARRGGKWLTVVYRDVQPGDEAREIGSHQKVAALSWSHALDDRDAAMAAAQEGGNAAKEA